MIRNRLFNFQFWPQFLTALIVVLAIAGYRYNTYYDTHSSDAFVTGAIVHVSALVPGSVAQVFVETNQSVKQGDKLVELDKAPTFINWNLRKLSINLLKTSSHQLKMNLPGLRQPLL